MLSMKTNRFTIRQTIYGFNIFQGGKKIEGAYETEHQAKARVELLNEREDEKCRQFMPAPVFAAMMEARACHAKA